MRRNHLIHLRCPKCGRDLALAVLTERDGRVERGTLTCHACDVAYPIEGSIPRFVHSEHNNYASGFGFQWNRHARTQYDRYSGISESADRYFNETRWGHDLHNQILLEAGSGSGRFTEHAASTGAMVISFDYSAAVEANFSNNGDLENVLIVQASLYEMPFPKEYFDKVLCIGVIQHTPDPDKSFACLVEALQPGGNLVIDAYRVFPWWKQALITKYWIRPITKGIPPGKLYELCERWVRLWWPITGLFQKLTGRRALSWFLSIADYRGVFPLPDDAQKEWAILDTFDMLAPAYDFPQTLASVAKWFELAKLTDVEVQYGYNGIEGRGTKP